MSGNLLEHVEILHFEPLGSEAEVIHETLACGRSAEEASAFVRARPGPWTLLQVRAFAQAERYGSTPQRYVAALLANTRLWAAKEQASEAEIESLYRLGELGKTGDATGAPTIALLLASEGTRKPATDAHLATFELDIAMIVPLSMVSHLARGNEWGGFEPKVPLSLPQEETLPRRSEARARPVEAEILLLDGERALPADESWSTSKVPLLSGGVVDAATREGEWVVATPRALLRLGPEARSSTVVWRSEEKKPKQIGAQRLAVTDDGDVYLGTSRGLLRWSRDAFDGGAPPAALDLGAIACVSAARGHGLAVGGKKFIALRQDDGSWLHHPVAGTVTEVHVAEAGIWARAGASVLVLTDTGVRLLGTEIRKPRGLAPLGRGEECLVFHEGSTLRCGADGSVRPAGVNRVLRPDKPRSSFLGGAEWGGELWFVSSVGAQDGLFPDRFGAHLVCHRAGEPLEWFAFARAWPEPRARGFCRGLRAGPGGDLMVLWAAGAELVRKSAIDAARRSAELVPKIPMLRASLIRALA